MNNGDRFGIMTLLGETSIKDSARQTIYHLRCDCGADVLTNRTQLKNTYSCGCVSDKKGGGRFGGMNIVVFNKRSVKLKQGFDYVDFIIKWNEDVPIYDICTALKISFDDVRKRYDRLSALKAHDVGQLNNPRIIAGPLMCARKKAGTLPTAEYAWKRSKA